MFLNLTEANLYGTPKWRVEYSAKVLFYIIFWNNFKIQLNFIFYNNKSAFNLDNLFPQDWSEVVDKALSNLEGSVANKFMQYFFFKLSLFKIFYIIQ